MCKDCGCGHVESFKIVSMQDSPAEGERVLVETTTPIHPHEDGHGHVHDHGDYTHTHDGHAHTHTHGGEPHTHAAHEHGPHSHTVPVHLPLLAKNDRLAERNRGFLAAKGIHAINIVSSPGSGKTTFIASTLEKIADRLPAAVIVGDLETANDAMRLRDKGAPVVQVTTGTVCHLDAEMVARGIEALELEGRRLLIIENVGNLVCPAAYDLGEATRVVLISVTEGEDKPLKYPPIFQGAQVVIVSKIDMVNAAGFDIALVRKNIKAVAPNATILEVSARTGEGMEAWIGLLVKRCYKGQ